MLDSVPHAGTTARKRAGLGLPHHFLLNLYVVLFVPAVASGQTASLRGQSWIRVVRSYQRPPSR